jgi:hypothetical protein
MHVIDVIVVARFIPVVWLCVSWSGNKGFLPPVGSIPVASSTW